ncbi:MAG: hypothetical protein JHD07_08860 [Bradyrhizobium sp.]|uniref:hypothetical protein n=1 Tax=Bradyrhizobium sp. TaxID=376 RepID=UPI001A23C4A7|nr:hypothetical protein [Bradyrhizobium sp.]MBJ7403388.1 hypothetical protein [Bradyrhizobium sp.]
MKHEHLATLGSIDKVPSIADRLSFWQALHQRLAHLSNRIDASQHAKALSDVHARIPMVTIDEQRALKLEVAQADEKLWDALAAMHEASANDQRRLGARAERVAIANQQASIEAATRAATMRDRIERLKRGEDAPGALKRFDPGRALHDAGWSKAEIEHAILLAMLPEEAFNEVIEASHQASERAGEIAARKAARAAARTREDDGPRDGSDRRD